jgi:citrate lyase subunit beta/citryl-CoA lyase
MSVPASSERFLAKARDLPADEVMLDLEDSVAPGAKDAARELAAGALKAGGWGERLVAVRVNDATTPWAYQDVIAVVTGAPGGVDSLVLPKVTSPSHVTWLDLLLGQAEQAAGVPAGRTRIEAQIEDAAGLAAVEAIASASPRLASLVFGPADFMASVGMRSLTVGGQPSGYEFDAHHYALMRILVAARSAGIQAIDGPYARIPDLDGLRAAASSVAALGYDGKWVLHPSQVEIVNGAFTPSADDYARALRILDVYQRATSLERRGAVMLDGEMIDEASRKMALRIAALGEAAGLLQRPPRPQRLDQPGRHRQAVQLGGPGPHRVVRVVTRRERSPGHVRRVVADVQRGVPSARPADGPDQAARCHDQPGLLANFPDQRVRVRLAVLDPPAWYRPQPLARLVPALDQQQPARLVLDHGPYAGDHSTAHRGDLTRSKTWDSAFRICSSTASARLRLSMSMPSSRLAFSPLQEKFALVTRRNRWSMEMNFEWFRTGRPSNVTVRRTTPGRRWAATSSVVGDEGRGRRSAALVSMYTRMAIPGRLAAVPSAVHRPEERWKLNVEHTTECRALCTR